VLFVATESYRLDEERLADGANVRPYLKIASPRAERPVILDTRTTLELVEDLERWLKSQGVPRNR
jgi:hypothetical protein